MQLTTFQQRALAWSAIAAVAVLLLWLFGPVLTPFLVGMVLAYALNPVVNWADGLFRGHMPRVVGVVLVELAFVLIVTGIVLLFALWRLDPPWDAWAWRRARKAGACG